MTMNGWMKLAAALFAAASFAGCSLLKVAVATGDPLSKEQMNVRTMTRGFYYDMAGEVARAADSIVAASPDVNVRVAAVRWKIRATHAGVTAAMQGIPDVALADLWILCRRMNEGFAQAPDSLLFGLQSDIARDAALRLDRHVHVVKNVDELYRVSDYITIHIPYNNSTKDFINAESIAKMKGQVRILNLARGGLVNDDDMIQALESGRVARYVTDFPDEKIAVAAHVVALPHLGASTPESEENCARMAADQLKDYLLNGNIKNSVNLPNVAQEWSGISRVCLIHQNIPAMLTKITSILSKEGVNVENLTNKSKKDYAYTMVDLNSRIKDKVAEELRAIPGMIRVRVLNH